MMNHLIYIYEQNIKIAGIDPSITSSGKVIMEIDTTDFSILSIKLYAYHGAKIRSFEDDRLRVGHLKGVGNKMNYSKYSVLERQQLAYKELDLDMEDVTHVAFEGYAYSKAKGSGRSSNSRGMVQLGEFIGSLKYRYFSQGKGIMVYPPTSVKKLATGKGVADKVIMQKQFQHDYPDFYHEYLDNLIKWENPCSDICDAFWICESLRLHMKYDVLGSEALEPHELIAVTDHTPAAEPICNTTLLRLTDGEVV